MPGKITHYKNSTFFAVTTHMLDMVRNEAIAEDALRRTIRALIAGTGADSLVSALNHAQETAARKALRAMINIYIIRLQAAQHVINDLPPKWQPFAEALDTILNEDEQHRSLTQAGTDDEAVTSTRALFKTYLETANADTIDFFNEPLSAHPSVSTDDTDKATTDEVEETAAESVATTPLTLDDIAQDEPRLQVEQLSQTIATLLQLVTKTKDDAKQIPLPINTFGLNLEIFINSAERMADISAHLTSIQQSLQQSLHSAAARAADHQLTTQQALTELNRITFLLSQPAPTESTKTQPTRTYSKQEIAVIDAITAKMQAQFAAAAKLQQQQGTVTTMDRVADLQAEIRTAIQQHNEDQAVAETLKRQTIAIQDAGALNQLRTIIDMLLIHRLPASALPLQQHPVHALVTNSDETIDTSKYIQNTFSTEKYKQLAGRVIEAARESWQAGAYDHPNTSIKIQGLCAVITYSVGERGKGLNHTLSKPKVIQEKLQNDAALYNSLNRDKKRDRPKLYEVVLTLLETIYSEPPYPAISILEQTLDQLIQQIEQFSDETNVRHANQQAVKKDPVINFIRTAKEYITNPQSKIVLSRAQQTAAAAHWNIGTNDNDPKTEFQEALWLRLRTIREHYQGQLEKHQPSADDTDEQWTARATTPAAADPRPNSKARATGASAVTDEHRDDHRPAAEQPDGQQQQHQAQMN